MLRAAGASLTWLALSACWLAGCRDEVVQTAYRSAGSTDGNGASGGEGGAPAQQSSPLACIGGRTANELPLGTAFGEGQAVVSAPLTASANGPGEGPGLYVAARDSFRVYLNGELVGESETARTPLWLPLSLLPGENVIALAISAAHGTPAALVQLDELDRSYVSDGDWRLSTAPEGAWTAPGYDDGNWDSASELADFGKLPGCDPTDTFPQSSEARWIGPRLGQTGPVALRLSVRIEASGFAEGTSGGGSREPAVVHTWEELESAAAATDPQVILLPQGVHDFRRTGADITAVDVCPSSCAEGANQQTYTVPTGGDVCAETLVTAPRDDRRLALSSNKTIVGLGRGAALRGVTFDVNGSQNVIVRNVALYDINRGILEAGDAFTLTAADGVWLDHVTARWVSDAFIDALPGTRGLTVSYSLFDGATEGECGGQEHWAATLTDTEATIHHTRFEQVRTRAPLADGTQSRVHLFNDVYTDTTDWTVGAGCLSQVLLEGSVFEHVQAVSRLSTCKDSSDLGSMNAVDGSNLYRDAGAVFLGGDAKEPHDDVFEPSYEYQAEPANEALPRVVSRAGAGGPWSLPLSR